MRFATDVRREPSFNFMFLCAKSDDYRQLVAAVHSDKLPSQLPDRHVAGMYAKVWNNLSCIDKSGVYSVAAGWQKDCRATWGQE